jgi:hypothetical protein
MQCEQYANMLPLLGSFLTPFLDQYQDDVFKLNR